METLVDTTVLIDFWRCAKQPGRLADLQAKTKGRTLALCWIVEAEFLRGALRQGPEESALRTFFDRFERIEFTREWLSIYARTWAAMTASGKVPGYPDLWIAAVALQRKVPLLTRNSSHFQDVPGLERIEYRLY